MMGSTTAGDEELHVVDQELSTAAIGTGSERLAVPQLKPSGLLADSL